MIAKFKLDVSSFLNNTQIIENELLRYAYSTDASLYRMIPKLILIIRTEVDVIKIISLASKYDIKLTFRTAGTSVSGQAVTDQVLVVLAADAWLDYKIYNNGKMIKLSPSIIAAEANKYLKIYDRKIGPDPGSINTAKIGGIISNNSSGMCCGTAKNSYATIESIRVLFSDGSILDTSDQKSIECFRHAKKDFIKVIENIRQKIVGNNDLSSFIKKKFSIKNTSGYSLNAFLDFTDPIKIIERLFVGSEGTLGFVSSVNLRTVPNYKHKALNLVYGKLDDLVKLTGTIEPFDISSVELLDYISLKSVSDQVEVQPYLIPLDDTNMAAIMIEHAEETEIALTNKLEIINKYIAEANTIHQVGFKRDESDIQTLWRIRNGIFPIISGQRPPGTSALTEDITVRISLLPKLIDDLKILFIKYNYNNAPIFGHVLSGNVHFILTPDFNDNAQILEYDEFMRELADVVAKKYNGSLKAEHGSGRNVSPFALVEWGEECWYIMWQIKGLFDPNNILNPEVKLTRDNTLHIKNLKLLNCIDNEIDKCMECGFCEPVCPSRNLSLTPRQRNTVARKIDTLSGDVKKQWQADFEYYGIRTCATTSLCKTRCPVGIDTGDFILSQKPTADKLVIHAKEIAIAKQKVVMGNMAGSILGKSNLESVTRFIHSKFKSIPIYLESMPKAQKHKFENKPIDKKSSRKVLLIPACPNRIFAGSRKHEKYPSELVLEKLGFLVEYPNDVNNQCCGQMYHSQLNNAQQQASQNLLKKIDFSKYEYVITDNSSCSNFIKQQGVEIINISKLILKYIDTLEIKKIYNKIALHIDCSTSKQNINQKYIDIIEKCCEKVVVPERIYCCGFAGDKGFVTPELNASSLNLLAPQVKGCDIGISFNRSCQIGLSNKSGVEYISFVELILECI